MVKNPTYQQNEQPLTSDHSTQKDHDIWHGNPYPCFGQTRSCGLLKNLVDQRNRET